MAVWHRTRAVQRGITDGIEWAVCPAPVAGVYNGYARQVAMFHGAVM